MRYEDSRVGSVPLKSVVGVSTTAGVISFCAEASFVSSLLISLLLIMQCALGQLLVVRVFQFGTSSELSNIALWSVVGTATTTSLDQLLCTFAGHASHFVYTAIVVTGAVASVVAAWKCQILGLESGTTLPALPAICLVVSLLLLPKHPWALPLAILFSILMLILSIEHSVGRHRTLVGIWTIVGGLWILNARAGLPTNRELIDDFQFSAAVESFRQWGYSVNPFKFGEPIRYHFASTAWLAHLANVSGSSGRQVLQSSGPAVAAVLLATALMGLAQQIFRSRRIAVLSICGLALSNTTIASNGWGFNGVLWESFSQVSSLVILAVALNVVLNTELTYRAIALMTFLLFFMGATKISTFLTFVGGAGVLLVVLVVGRKVRTGTALLSLSILMVLVFIVLRLFTPRSVVPPSIRPEWPAYLLPDLAKWQAGNAFRWYLLVLVLLTSFVVVPLLAPLIALKQKLVSMPIFMFLYGCLVAGCLQTLVGPPNQNSFYGLHSLTVISIPLLIGALTGSLITPGLLLGAFLGATIAILIKELNPVWETADTNLYWLVLKPNLAFLVCAVCLLFSLGHRLPSNLTRLVASSLVGVLLAHGLINLAELRKWVIEEYSVATEINSDDVLQWIDENTPREAIVAVTDKRLITEPIRRTARPAASEHVPMTRLQSQIVGAIGDTSCEQVNALVYRGITTLVVAQQEIGFEGIDECASRVFVSESWIVFRLE